MGKSPLHPFSPQIFTSESAGTRIGCNNPVVAYQYFITIQHDLPDFILCTSIYEVQDLMCFIHSQQCHLNISVHPAPLVPTFPLQLGLYCFHRFHFILVSINFMPVHAQQRHSQCSCESNNVCLHSSVPLSHMVLVDSMKQR